jgi:hypothetical protein
MAITLTELNLGFSFISFLGGLFITFSDKTKAQIDLTTHLNPGAFMGKVVRTHPNSNKVDIQPIISAEYRIKTRKLRKKLKWEILKFKFGLFLLCAGFICTLGIGKIILPN